MIPNTLHNAVKAYLEKEKNSTLESVVDWPPQNQELNFVKAVWDHLDREWNERQPNIQRRAFNLLQEACRITPEDDFREITKTCPREFRPCCRKEAVV